MKCRHCHGSGVDPKGKWTEEELQKVAKQVFDSSLSQKESWLVDQINEMLDDEKVTDRGRKRILVELGAAFPTIQRTYLRLGLKIDPSGKLAPEKPMTDAEKKALREVSGNAP